MKSVLRTLIVEDESVIRRGLIATFDWEAAGCIVVGDAQTGREGLQKMAELRPDLVIADICMPDMNGLTMIEEGQRICRFSSILLTGYPKFEYAKLAIELHVHAYLLKPIRHEELLHAIRTLPRENETEKTKPLEALWKPDEYEAAFLRGSDDYHISYMLTAIKERYFTHISIEALAEEMFVSKSYLSRKIREETGATFTDLLSRYRVQKAVELLEEKKLRINEVAWETGFHDYKHFSSVFKKYMKMPPTEYMSRLHGKETQMGK